MNIIDHLSIGVPDIEAACRFYDGLLGALGYSQVARTDSFAAYGDGTVQFLVMIPSDGEDFSAGNGTHICFRAKTPQAVDKFHDYALSNGGRDAGAPGPRKGYPIPDIYTAFIRDPFNNKLEAIHNGFNP